MLQLATRFKGATRSVHTCTRIPPNPCPSVRNLALPLAFLDVKGWDPQGLDGWATWTRLFAQAGYSPLLIQLDPSSPSITGNVNTSQALLATLEADLHSLLSQHSPFPPLLFSSSHSTLLSQTYVSSHPLSGLLLHHPTPPSLLPPCIFPTALQEFTYEPNFPVGVMDELAQFERSRLGQDWSEEEQEEGEGWVGWVQGGRDERGWERVMEWMDENGL